MENGIYTNLTAQLDKLHRHTRQGSYQTRERYLEAMKRFCRFLADEYQLQKLSNLAPKHLHKYVEYLQDTDIAASTIKTDLAGIRFFHDQIPGPRHSLPDNSAFDLERRSYGKKDKTWSYQEFAAMRQLAVDRDDYATALTLAYYAGMRVEECFTIDTAMAEEALRKNAITFHGKGGRWRTVPINEHIAGQLQIMLTQVKRGQKLLTPEGVPVRDAISRFQLFIINNRDKAEAPNRETHMTAHGLRHSYACNTYRELRAQGFTHEKTCKWVSVLLGHDRPDIVRTYLVSVLRDGDAHV